MIWNIDSVYGGVKVWAVICDQKQKQELWLTGVQ